MKDPTLPRASFLGTSAMLFEAEAALGLDVQERVWAVAKAAEAWPGVQEAVPGMNNLMVVFDPFALTSAALEQQVHAAWFHAPAVEGQTKTVELPVVYGGEHGPDLAAIAERTGLEVATVVRLHSEATYAVFFLGAHPGFAYLAGLDPRLHTPRRAEPRLHIRAGTVAIGGAQAGVVAQTSPSGWQLIGHCEQSFFDAHRTPPTLLCPGDTVVFRATRIDT